MTRREKKKSRFEKNTHLCINMCKEDDATFKKVAATNEITNTDLFGSSLREFVSTTIYIHVNFILNFISKRKVVAGALKKVIPIWCVQINHSAAERV